MKNLKKRSQDNEQEIDKLVPFLANIYEMNWMADAWDKYYEDMADFL